jgi:hypothetical protein
MPGRRQINKYHGRKEAQKAHKQGCFRFSRGWAATKKQLEFSGNKNLGWTANVQPPGLECGRMNNKTE